MRSVSCAIAETQRGQRAVDDDLANGIQSTRIANAPLASDALEVNREPPRASVTSATLRGPYTVSGDLLHASNAELES